MGKYKEFWIPVINYVLDRLEPGKEAMFDYAVNELSKLGERESTGYNGRLFLWNGEVEKITDSAVFRNLAEVLTDKSISDKIVPGRLHLRVYGNAVLKVHFVPLTYNLLIQRYKEISPEKKRGELYKWKLIKEFQDNWVNYQNGKVSFQDLLKETDFKNLVYNVVPTVFSQVLDQAPKQFEKLLSDLYNEDIDLQIRIDTYVSDFEKLYYTLPIHGKNTFQEERTIATLLTFRYPEKYTFYKQSFFSKLCEGLGINMNPDGRKLVQYYSCIGDFQKNYLSLHGDIITEKNSRLDETCYIDKNNLILAQDILYLTLDAKSKIDELSPEVEMETRILPIKMEEMNLPLNLILYGPPGTGKTYQSINKAVKIVSQEFDIENKSRPEIRAEYERLVKEGHIEFITFHQSMSYEDFIEGIKPVEPKEEDEFLKYEVRDGIFKKLAEKAKRTPESAMRHLYISEEEFDKASIYKISLGNTSNPDDDEIYEWCIKNGYIALGWGGANNFTGLTEQQIAEMVPSKLEKYEGQAVNYIVHYIKIGDFVVVSYGNKMFRAIGKVVGPYEFKNVGLRTHQLRKVEWLIKDVELPYSEIYNKQFSQQSLYQLNKKEIKRTFFVSDSDKQKGPSNPPKNFVLIIDEINRGNISQIFGDLITLIEEDKREGREESLTTILPYSRQEFSVPDNLYIIGTMNTADRSVEALDTALRRRFNFEAISPEPSRVSSRPEGIDLSKMLEKMNDRLEALLSKDHTVGHAWLMSVKSVDDLRLVFKNKILPLLQEYFYTDYAKIGLVLGKNFVETNLIGTKMFAAFEDGSDLAGEYSEKSTYRLRDPLDMEAEDFISIYQ